jgi:hypothetical protein
MNHPSHPPSDEREAMNHPSHPPSDEREAMNHPSHPPSDERRSDEPHQPLAFRSQPLKNSDFFAHASNISSLAAVKWGKSLENY